MTARMVRLPKTALVRRRRRGRGPVRRRVLQLLKRAYVVAEGSRFGGLTRWAVVQRIRGRLVSTMTAAEVADLAAALSDSGIHFWLVGGWGVDALVGEQTRLHKDLDLAVESRDARRALEVLEQLGFRPAWGPTSEQYVPAALLPIRRELQDSRMRTIDLHPLASGDLATRSGVDQPFADGRVGGRLVPCLSVDAQLATRRGYELRAQDVSEIRLLHSLMSEDAGAD